MTELLTVPIETIAGESTTLGAYGGKVLLVVNVASKCGLTPQYEGLETVYKRYRDQGFEVLAFPANDFREQEPGTNDEILEFCRSTYAVDFPVFAKVTVTGEDKHPLYEKLTSAIPRAAGDPDKWRAQLRGYGIEANDDPEILWNFEKFLISRTGRVVARFAPALTPDSPEVIATIESELAQSA